jgi:two-component system cell cycle sensor histidine kinase/response regulator CckA
VIVKNVLILDDHPAMLHGIAEVLRSEDYSVLEAATGLQAIEIGRQCWRLSLLVSDIEVPDLSGTEVALALCGLYPHLPILFMSGNAIADWSSQDRTNLQRFIPDLVGFLEKPFSASDLKMRVRSLVGRRSQIEIVERQGNQAA